MNGLNETMANEFRVEDDALGNVQVRGVTYGKGRVKYYRIWDGEISVVSILVRA